MKHTKPLMGGLLAVTAVAAALGLSGWLGPQRGRTEAALPVPARSTVDPAQWSVPQGEEATRRHIRDGLKAGDLDPVTGLRIRDYHDPMVPGRSFDAPGKSPFMDMMLVPRYAGTEAADGSSVTVSPRMSQNLGLRTAPVVEGMLVPEVQVAGNIAWNVRDQVQIDARAMGFVEKLHLRAPLDRVVAGAPLLDLYLPDWVAAQEEYLALARLPGPDTAALREAARARMRQLGMSEAQIDDVATRGAVQRRLTLTAPISGIVAELMVREGATVAAGTPLMRLQGTASVWAEAQLPESQAALVAPGTRVSATSPALPDQILEGRVQVLLPEVDPATRTRRARVELANPAARLMPGMFVQMRFAQADRAKALVVPSDAVIRTGRRNVVMLAEEGGHYRPVEVRIGLESGDRIEIIDGLTRGQQVVHAGQFLIDSEASLRGLETRLNPTAGVGQ